MKTEFLTVTWGQTLPPRLLILLLLVWHGPCIYYVLPEASASCLAVGIVLHILLCSCGNETQELETQQRAELELC